MDSQCVVFVCDYGYFSKFLKTVQQLREQGEYKGDVCLVIGDDLLNNPCLEEVLKEYQVTVKHFPDLLIPDETRDFMADLDRDIKLYLKVFQFHKFYCFHTYFKQWRRILYMDCGMHIFRPIQPLLDCWKENKFLAHSDAFPLYARELRSQFVPLSPYIDVLEAKYDMGVDYPQTTIMVYDTNIIEEGTFQELVDLMMRYPNVRSNDQGILALYFIHIKAKWQQIQTGDAYINYYDYLVRTNDKPYVMVKVVF